MIKLTNLIKEVSTQEYNYGCAMLYFTFPEMDKIHGLIKKQDIYTEDDDKSFGLEDESHCTLLYGLHEGISSAEIKRVTDKFTYYTCEIHNPSLFENEDYDVLKFDVRGDNLKETNKLLTKFPHTSDYPDFHPHMTIGYLKKGMGKKYVNLLKKLTGKIWLAPQYIMYSEPNGTKTKINIKID